MCVSVCERERKSWNERVHLEVCSVECVHWCVRMGVCASDLMWNFFFICVWHIRIVLNNLVEGKIKGRTSSLETLKCNWQCNPFVWILPLLSVGDTAIAHRDLGIHMERVLCMMFLRHVNYGPNMGIVQI